MILVDSNDNWECNKRKEGLGLVVERRPVYHNETIVNERIEVTLDYALSDFKNRELMYKKMLSDVELLRKRLIETQKVIGKEEKNE